MGRLFLVEIVCVCDQIIVEYIYLSMAVARHGGCRGFLWLFIVRNYEYIVPVGKKLRIHS